MRLKLNQYFGFLRSIVIYYRPTQIIRWGRFYRNLLKPGDLAFDVGAHVGSKSRFMNSAGVNVVAMEPQEPFASFLGKTLPKKIKFVQAAAGEENQNLTMSVSSKHPTVSSLGKSFLDSAKSAKGFENVSWDKKQLVKVVTLDSLIDHYGVPDYIKIDVEGFELQVLKGISRPVKIISFEFLPSIPKLAENVVERLSQLGEYRFNPVVGEQARFLWGTWADKTSLQNWISAQAVDSKSVDIFAKLEG